MHSEKQDSELLHADRDPRTVMQASAAAIGRLSSIDLVLDCMGSIHPIHLYGKRYRRNFFTIEYEGVIIISIDL